MDYEQHWGPFNTFPCLLRDSDDTLADSKQVMRLDEISYDGLALNISFAY